MKTIWKIHLDVVYEQIISVPAGSDLLSIQEQNGTPVLWFLCDPSKQTEQHNRKISIYDTGRQLPDNPGEYISTFQLHGGRLVFHAFEKK